MKEKTYKYSPHEPDELDAAIIESHDRLVQLERRNLLVVSFVLLFSYITSLNPAKATFLGLTFDHFSEKHFYLILVVLILYFLTACLVYGYPKFRTSIKSKKETLSKAMTITTNVSWWHIEWPRIWLDIRYWAWLSFHYLLPIAVSIIAIFIGIIKIV